MKEAAANLKACYTNYKRGNITHFQPPYRTKRNEMLHGWTLNLDRANVKKDGDHLHVFPDVLGEMRYHGRKQLYKLLPAEHPAHDCKLQRSPFGEYFLLLSVDVTPRQLKTENTRVGIQCDESGGVKLQLGIDRAVAIDPGVRKFLTTYSPDTAESFMIGKGLADELYVLLRRYDAFQSELAELGKATGQSESRRRLQGRMLRLRERIFYRKKEERDQAANFLASRYSIVLMPKLDTKALALSSARTLTTKVARQMLCLGHAKFVDRLKEKCAEYGSVHVTVTEHYTSKTCVQCGRLNTCDETYRCARCGFTCDRDVVGAAGIFLRAVRTDRPMTVARPRVSKRTR